MIGAEHEIQLTASCLYLHHWRFCRHVYAACGVAGFVLDLFLFYLQKCVMCRQVPAV
jgi:hypothetical protein